MRQSNTKSSADCSQPEPTSRQGQEVWQWLRFDVDPSYTLNAARPLATKQTIRYRSARHMYNTDEPDLATLFA